MNKQQLLRIQIAFTSLVTLAIWSLLVWQYFHQGVPTHHLLQRADMPAISNWWGGILLPVLSWLLVGRVNKRILNDDNGATYPVGVIIGFVGALIYGVGLSVAFFGGYPEIASVLFQGILLLALFARVYREECLLGFILSMSIGFGAVLPTLFGMLIATASAIVYHTVHFLLPWIGQKLRSSSDK